MTALTYSVYIERVKSLLRSQPAGTGLKDGEFEYFMDGESVCCGELTDSRDDASECDESAWDDVRGCWDCSTPEETLASIESPVFTPPRGGITLPVATADDVAFIEASKIADEPLKARIVMERAVVRKALEGLFAAGYQVRLHDGGEYATELTADVGVVMKELMACDEESIVVFRQATPADAWKRFGSIFLVYGNAGYEVISDYNTNLEEALTSTNTYIDQLSELG